SGAVVVAGAAVAGGSALAADEPTVPSPAVVQLDQQTAEHLAATREEERMARDLYTVLDKHHDGLAPFSMIKNAEQRHFDAVGRALELHGLDDPSEDGTAGTYADADLQKLYDGWLARGKQSTQEAFTVGVELETADIAGLEEMIDDVDNAHVDRLLGHLLQGSEHHLDAFTKAVNGELPAAAGMRQGPHGQTGPGMPGPGMRGPGQQQGPQGMPGEPGQMGRRGMQQRHQMQNLDHECPLGT